MLCYAGVPSLLRYAGWTRPQSPEVRWMDETAEIRKEQKTPAERPVVRKALPGTTTRIYPFGINRIRLEQAISHLELPAKLASDVKEANLLITSKSHYRRKPQPILDAEAAGISIYVLRNNKSAHMERSLINIFDLETPEEPISLATKEAEEAIAQVLSGKKAVELSPQNSYLRMLQHQLAERHSLSSQSTGREPRRRVRIFHSGDGAQ